MLCEEIIQLNTGCEPSYGGIAKLRLIEFDSVQSFPQLYNGLVLGNLVLKTGKNLVEWQPDMLSFFRENRKQSQQRSFYEQELAVNFTKDSSIYTKNLHLITRGVNYTIIYTDKNGLHKVVQKVQCDTSLSTGDSKGRNFYAVFFRNSVPLPAYPINLNQIVTA